MEKIKVFCLPYAGGSKSIYYDWIGKYSEYAEVIPIEYSGHGSRFGEVLYYDPWDLAEDVCNSIISCLPKRYIIFGHSMGSLIAFLCCYLINERYGYSPQAIVIGGARPPHLKYKNEKWKDLSKNKLFDKLIEMGQMQKEILDEPELVDLLYDILKADICLNEKKIITSGLVINTPIIAMMGLKDNRTTFKDICEWEKYTTGYFQYKIFNGNHFFPFNCYEFEKYFEGLLKHFIL